ncbi:MAG: hypothetical protein JWL85_718 [Candidatus Saccharibacteria bacterium]|nr:hypothetical protein [Candidatus Saccharibacteria bacterium]
MKSVASKIKPTSGFSHIFHQFLMLLLPLLVFILVRMHFVQMAAALILLSKWRMLAVRPRYWLSNIRANAVDITVGLSLLIFMAHSSSGSWQMVWMIAYAAWLLVIKPGSSVAKISLQALVSQVVGLMALFIAWGDAPLLILVVLAWAVSYISARHFFSNFDEPYTALFSQAWGYFAGAVTWILGHWLLFYGSVSQPTLLLSVVGFGLGGLYYLDQKDRLSPLLRRQFVFIMVAIVIVVLAFSDWGDKTI